MFFNFAVTCVFQTLTNILDKRRRRSVAT